MKTCPDVFKPLLTSATSEWGTHVPGRLSQFPSRAGEKGEVVLTPAEEFAVSGRLRARALLTVVPATECRIVLLCPGFPLIKFLRSSTVLHSVQDGYTLFSGGALGEAVGYWCFPITMAAFIEYLYSFCQFLRFRCRPLEGGRPHYLISVVKNQNQRSSPCNEAIGFLLGPCVLTAGCPVKYFGRGVAFLDRCFMESFADCFEMSLEFADDSAVSVIEGVHGAFHNVLNGGWAVL